MEIKEKNEDFFTHPSKYISDPNEIFKHISNCKCCHRHQIHRPSSMNDEGEYCASVRFPRLALGQQKFRHHPPSCSCPCRHLGRALYHIYNDVDDTEHAYLSVIDDPLSDADKEDFINNSFYPKTSVE